MIPAVPQGGQPAPQMPPPGMGTGPAAHPGHQAGQAQNAAAGISTAVKMLQESLSAIPIGSELHKSVLKAITDISKNMNTDAVTPQAQMQQLVAQARQQQGAVQAPNLGGAPAPSPAQPPMPAPMGNG